MKKRTLLIPVLAVAAALLLASGCGGSGGNSNGGSSVTGGSSATVSEAELGVPIYPGATQETMGGGPEGGSTPMGSRPEGDRSGRPTDSAPGWSGPPLTDGSGGPGGTMPDSSAPGGGGMRGGMGRPLAMLRTSDDVDEVISWYREKLEEKSGFKENQVTGMGPDSATATEFSFGSGDDARVVMISEAFANPGGENSSAAGNRSGTMIIIRSGAQDNASPGGSQQGS